MAEDGREAAFLPCRCGVEWAIPAKPLSAYARLLKKPTNSDCDRNCFCNNISSGSWVTAVLGSDDEKSLGIAIDRFGAGIG